MSQYRRWYSSILDIQSFRGANCDTDYYPVVAKVGEILAVSKQAAQKFDGERFNLRKLNELEVRKQYQIEITNRCAVLENLSDSENNKEHIKTSAKVSLGLHDLKQHKPWFDEECLGFLDQRKGAKVKLVQDQSQSNVDNLNNVRRDTSRHFRNKKKEYLKTKIEKNENSNKIQSIRDLNRGINDFKKCYLI